MYITGHDVTVPCKEKHLCYISITAEFPVDIRGIYLVPVQQLTMIRDGVVQSGMLASRYLIIEFRELIS